MLNFSLNAKKRMPINAMQAKQKLLMQQMHQMKQQKMIEQMQQNRSKTIKEPITCSESNVSVEPTECAVNNVCEETTVITYLIGENNVECNIYEPKLEEPVIESLT